MSISSHYSAYRDSLVLLHDLIEQGQGDSEAADALRERMDVVWMRLQPNEIRLIRDLSADFYGVNADAKDAKAGARFRDEITNIRFRTYAEVQWRMLYNDLKRCEGLLKAEYVFYYKSTIWGKFGDQPAALWLLKKCTEIDASNLNFKYLYLGLLRKLEPNDAVDEALKIAAIRDQAPLLLFKAADILLEHASESASVDTSDYQRILSVYQQAFANVARLGQSEIPRSVLYGGRVVMGLCFSRIGKMVDAENSYAEAIRINPDSDVAFVARGILYYDWKTEAALKDFDRAIKMKAPLVWPYFCMAHWALKNADHKACIKFCKLALDHTVEPEIKAQIVQWHAISRFHFNKSKDDLGKGLKKARELSPHSLDIEHNLIIFESEDQSKAAEHWDLLGEHDVLGYAAHWRPREAELELDAVLA